MQLPIVMPTMVKGQVQFFLMMSVAQGLRADWLAVPTTATLLTVAIWRMLVFAVITHVSNMIPYQQYIMALYDV